ncbi:MAG: exodeoxyribonuclease VII small subunit [Bdellovibrio sp.]|nr:MAG: exodeoxyribonuclease VII small subunit [Bdellovibrio sp.]
MDFERKLSRLEEIVQKMEKGELKLEESLQLFEEGVRISKECQIQLTEAEAKVKKLVGFDQQGQPLTEDFIPEKE